MESVPPNARDFESSRWPYSQHTWYLSIIFLTSSSSLSSLFFFPDSPRCRKSLSDRERSSAVRESRYSGVFLIGSSRTSSRRALRVQPMRGPGFTWNISMSRLPSVLSMVTEIGSRRACSTIALYLRNLNGCSVGLPVPIRLQIRRLSRSQIFSCPTFVITRRTAERVIWSGSEKNICQRTSLTTFSIVSREKRKSSNAFFVTREPTTSCPWKVQSFFSSDQRRVSGLEISWKRPASRISKLHPLSAPC